MTNDEREEMLESRIKAEEWTPSLNAMRELEVKDLASAKGEGEGLRTSEDFATLDARGDEDLAKGLSLLYRLRYAAMELAQYASYAEIVGGIKHNQPQIRKYCDETIALYQESDEFIRKLKVKEGKDAARSQSPRVTGPSGSSVSGEAQQLGNSASANAGDSKPLGISPEGCGSATR